MESKLLFSFFAFVFVLGRFLRGGGGCFIHFSASEKDLGSLGLWDCSPYLHKRTNMDQLDSGIAVHRTDTQTNTQVYRMIQVYLVPHTTNSKALAS